MFSKRNLGLALVVLLSLAMFAIAVGCAEEEEDTYKIGALFAVTGFNSPLGTPERDTAVMLVKQINEAGGIKGKDLEIIIYDTKSEETESLTLAKKLIEQDKVLAIVGPSSSGESLAIIDTMTKAETPLVSCAASAKIVEPVSERKWIFKTPQTDVLAVGMLYDYLRAKNLTKVALLTASGGFGSTGKVVLEDMAPAEGISIVAAESFGDKDTDMRAQITKIKGAGAQALIVWGTNPGPALIAKQAKEVGLGLPIFNSHGIANEKFIELAGDAANGVTFPAGKLLLADLLPDSDPQKSLLIDFRDSFEEEYGRSADTFGGHAYDAIKLLVNAIEKVGADKSKIRDELEKTTGFVGTGGIFNMSTQDHHGLTREAFNMVQIKNGEWAPAE